MTTDRQLKIGLALGSGGAKGLAHIGVIKILEENDIPIDFIAGASIGALIGGLYAAFKDIKAIEKNLTSSNWRQILSFILDPSIKGGLISGKKLETFIRSQINHIQFSELKIPFAAVATDLNSGESVIIKEGDVSSAIRASIAVPLVFKPIKKEGQLLVDGGVSKPVPVQIVRQMGADFVIAVNLDGRCFPNDKKGGTNFYAIARQTLYIMRYHLAKYDVEKADLIIAPEVKISGIIGWRNFIDGQKFVLAGEKATKDQLSRLKQLIKLDMRPKMGHE